MSDSEVLVRARGLTKRFGDFTAVDGIDFDLYRGEAFGFLGPNGAGKSSTMRMIGCVSPPSGGEMTILGRDPVRDGSAIRARLGVVPQEDTLDVELTVRENLLVYGRYFGLPRRVIRERTDALLDFVQLSDRAGDKVDPLSGGLKRRLTIARSLINEPEILILDEPTTGLDPQARHATWDLIGQLRSAGVSIILTTHFMEEAERLCDYVAIIDHGQLVAAGTPGQLTGTVGQLRFRAEPGLDIDSLLAALPPASLAKESPAGHYVIEVHGAVDPLLLAAVTAWCAERGVLATSLRSESRTLEDVFLELTGKELRS